MARWKLLQPHYINIPGTEWEYAETDRKTGRPKRTKFAVPTFLHPLTSDDWNYRDGDEGIIVVTDKVDPEFPKDYVFLGEPTPDMEPMDDAAREISGRFAARWQHPIEGLPATGAMGYSQSLLDGIERQVAAAAAKQGEVVQAQAEGMKDVLTTMAAMMKQNQELIAVLAADKAAGTRRA